MIHKDIKVAERSERRGKWTRRKEKEEEKSSFQEIKRKGTLGEGVDGGLRERVEGLAVTDGRLGRDKGDRERGDEKGDEAGLVHPLKER